MAFNQSELAKRLVPVGLSDIVNGIDVDPAIYPVFLAFMQPGLQPSGVAGGGGPTDWVAATWVTDGEEYAAQLLVGPNDGNVPFPQVSLTVGTWVIWYQVNTGYEQVVDIADTISITDATSYRIPVVSVQELADYMDYPFLGTQVIAAAAVVDNLTGELERFLHADLTQRAWTEQYTVPYDGPTLFTSSIFGTEITDLYLDVDLGGLAQAVGPVRLKHWPIVSYVGASVLNSADAVWAAFDPTQLPVPPEDLPQFIYGTSLNVNYVAGWDGPQYPDLKGVIMRAASRELTNRLDDARGMRGTLSPERLPDGSGNDKVTPGFTGAELQRLKRFKRRVIV